MEKVAPKGAAFFFEQVIKLDGEGRRDGHASIGERLVGAAVGVGRFVLVGRQGAGGADAAE